jgi:hypothetical protein
MPEGRIVLAANGEYRPAVSSPRDRFDRSTMHTFRIATTLAVLVTALGIPAAHAADDHPIVGKKLLLRRSSAGRERLIFSGGDPGTVTVAPFIEDGARLEFFTAAVPTGIAMDLPASNWSVARQFVVRFANRAAPNDLSPLSTAVVESRRYVKTTGKLAGLALDAPLGRVGVRITAGDTRWCTLFTEAETIVDVPGRFSARRTPIDVVPDCRADSLGGIGSPSGAFLGD